MADTLPAPARRVTDAAATLGLSIDVRQMPASTRTAEEAAATCGCAVGQIVKSLIFAGRDSDTPYLLLVSGDNRVNEKAVGRLIGEKLRRPDADFVRATTGYAIGGIPPLGHATEIRTLIDRDLLNHEVVWAAAGTHTHVFPVDPQALAEATGAEIIDVTR